MNDADRQRGWLAVKSRLFSVNEAPGWALYLFGLLELIWAWPWPRFVGVIAVGLGLFDHARGVQRALRRGD